MFSENKIWDSSVSFIRPRNWGGVESRNENKYIMKTGDKKLDNLRGIPEVCTKIRSPTSAETDDIYSLEVQGCPRPHFHRVKSISFCTEGFLFHDFP